jgi:hypothetical protein
MSHGMLRGVGKGGREKQGAPRKVEAAMQALKLAGFSKEEAESRTKQKTLSKRRRKAE